MAALIEKFKKLEGLVSVDYRRVRIGIVLGKRRNQDEQNDVDLAKLIDDFKLLPAIDSEALRDFLDSVVRFIATRKA